MLFPKAQLLEKSRNEFRKSFVKRMDYATSTRNTPIEIPNNFENQSVVDSCTVMEGLSRALFYFLKNGMFPWWLSDKHDVRLHVIFSPVLENPLPGFVDRIRHLLSHDTNALKRLACQFPIEFLTRLIELLREEISHEIKHLYPVVESLWAARSLKNLNSGIQYSDCQGMIAILVARDENVKEIVGHHIRRWIREGIFSFDDVRNVALSDPGVFPLEEMQALRAEVRYADAPKVSSENYSMNVFPVGNDVQNEINKLNNPRLDEVYGEQSIDESIHVSYAGLVILHPFLPYFFDALDLLNADKQFRHESARSQAVYLLGYLASGKEDTAESELPFCKYLCDLPLKAALEKSVALDSETREESQRLLQSVVSHWSVLKDTSPEGLREAFLSRKGKLDFKDDNPVLYVEHMPYDILLEKLPWGIGYVQLPWLKKPLVTSWN